MALSVAIYNLNNRNPISNNRLNGGSDSNSSSPNTNLLNGGKGDSVTFNGNPEIAKLQNERISLEMEQTYLSFTIENLKIQIMMEENATSTTLFGYTGDNVIGSQNKESKQSEKLEKLKKELEAKQAKLENVNARIEEIKSEIAALKAKDEAKKDTVDIDALDDTQKAELLKQKEQEMQELIDKNNEIREKIEELQNKLRSMSSFVQRHFTSEGVQAQNEIAKLESQYNQNLKKGNEVWAVITSLKAAIGTTGAGETNGTSDKTTDYSSMEEQIEAGKGSIDAELEAILGQKNAGNDDPLWAIGNGNNSVNSTNQLSEEALKNFWKLIKTTFIPMATKDKK